ncbi:MAG: transcriptional activator NhaR [Burkholderiales bacterium]|nr:MAG: transcriptional activator NhaR [Burkholderiales bacterium]
MENLNYKHLHYFWMIAKCGGVAKAGERLHVTPQSISTQIRQLEAAVGSRLWRRAGRKLELTDTGHMVMDYADRLFTVGEELKDALRSGVTGHGHFKIGVTDVVAKTMAYRLIKPALGIPDPPRLDCREGSFVDLLAQLAVYKLDVVISDRPMHTSMSVRGYNHLLLECGVSFLAQPKLANKLRSGFPASLHAAPFLLPGKDAAVRPRLQAWFDKLHIQPQVVAEFDDRALMKAFGQEGAGVFSVPSVVADEVSKQLGLQIFGKTAEVQEQAYAVTSERRIKHPAAIAISEAAKLVA